MTTVLWRPEVNALTTPQSYFVRYLPRNTVGYEELAVEIARENPNYNKALVQAIMVAVFQKIQENLINGNQVTLENTFTYRLSFSARLDEINEPLPKIDNLVQIKSYPSQPFISKVRQAVKLERLPLVEKSPLIATTVDTRLKLNDVLYPKGVLKITGHHLSFEDKDRTGECVIAGTQGENRIQQQFALISNSTILVVPDIPEPEQPWNNEYRLSISVRYTENGLLRTSIYQRFLRSPLLVTGIGSDTPIEVGLLTGQASSPYVTITGGTLTADEIVRIQVVLDLNQGHLLFNLLDMTESGRAGEVIQVNDNGEYTLTGFTGSALTHLVLTVNQFADLVEIVRRDYSGRLIDILEMKRS